jgi:nucleotide-binding universal stress UspA family protein
MKTMICPTDAGMVSGSVVSYAEALARATHTQLIVKSQPDLSEAFFNEHFPAGASPEIVGPVPAGAAVAQPVEPVVQREVMRSIAAQARRERADLIAMGATADQSLGEVFTGPVARLTAQARCPVLVIPESAVYRPVKRIIVAIEREVDITHRIDYLAELASQLGAEVIFLQVTAPHCASMACHYYGSITEMYLSFPYRNVSYKEIMHECAITGIENFARYEQADLLVIVPNPQNPCVYPREINTNYRETVFHPLSTPVLALDSRPVPAAGPQEVIYNHRLYSLIPEPAREN